MLVIAAVFVNFVVFLILLPRCDLQEFNSDFHKPKHLHSWKTLVRSEKSWSSISRALRSNVDVAITLFRNGPWQSAV